jgi:hypothetical protein
MRRQESKTKRRTITPSFWNSLSFAVAVAAVLAALGLTLLALASSALPTLADRYLGIDSSYRSNLVVEVLFFWIEVSAIIIGMRLLDANADRASRIRNAAAIHDVLIASDDRCYEMRMAFARKLDGNRKDGFYDTDVFALRSEIVAYRNETIGFFLSMENFGAVESKMFDRTLRIFDIAISEMREQCSEAQRLNEKLKKAGKSNGDLDADERRKTLEELDGSLGKLLDSADLWRMGFSKLAEALASTRV